ncbi:hypothetical protein KIH86_24030 [Paenibacillus sp. HN-1]|uniref:YopX family protein n=1 Tax=Paenibacillus TaxID=44249 RepID=UPI001CAA0645|nr:MULTISPECIES: YopX family protein [Paenibacillus]MBY9081220.1 hypothetical protein [Paenibacillus sp. CGMCC 1.18879]MBY9087257.1 hypothetical protein [Paenibacillus sinensis]
MNKYRGQSTDTGEWVYGYLIGTDVIVGGIVEFNDEYFNTEYWYKVDPETVGQYTGLKDKNGREAHHKDIVEFEDLMYVIEWDEVDTGFYLAHHACRNDPESEYHLLGNCIRECEVIGNIYENPELLEV